MKFFVNTLVAALIIATVAEVGKRSAYAGALLVALPLTSILALAFLYVETKDIQKVSSLSYGIFWLVLPTLLFFLMLPALLKTGLNFWGSLVGLKPKTITFRRLDRPVASYPFREPRLRAGRWA